MIKLEHIQKKHYDNSGIEDFSYSFQDHGFYILHGPSGAGKSTLLDIIGLVTSFDDGKYYLWGNDISKLKQEDIESIRLDYIGYIYQNFNLFDNLTVYENIKIVCNEISKGFDEIDSLLSMLDLEKIKNKKVIYLSGGQKQRVAIARALIKHPKIILADEPTGNLDNLNTLKIMNILRKISKDTLVICVTHDDEIAKNYADFTVEILDGKLISSPKENCGTTYDKCLCTNKKRISLVNTFIECFKLYNASIISRITSAVVMIFLITLLLGLNQINCFSLKKMLYNEIENSNLNYIILNDNEFIKNDVEGNFNGYRFYNDVDLKFDTKTRYYDIGSSLNDDLYVCDLDNSLFTLMEGRLPTSEYEIVISSYLNEKYKNPMFININETTYFICGIFKTDFKYEENNKYLDPLILYETNTILVNNYKNMLPNYIKTYDFINFNDGDMNNYLNTNVYNSPIEELNILYGSNMLNDGEIIINERFLTKNNKPYTYYLGKTVDLVDIYEMDDSFYKYFSPILIRSKFKIVGIASNSAYTTNGLALTFSDNDFEASMSIYEDYFLAKCFAVPKSKTSIDIALSTGYGLSFFNADDVYSASVYTNTMRIVCIIFSCLVILIFLFYVLYEIKLFIRDNKRNLSTLLSVGIPKREIIFSISLYYTLIMILGIGFGITISYIIFSSLNKSIQHLAHRLYPFYIFQNNIIGIFITLLFVLSIYIICIISSLRRLHKNNINEWININ